MSLADYHYGSGEASHVQNYLMPTVLRLLPPPCRIFELGCGNGATAHELAKLGYEVMGVDPSKEGIQLGRLRPGVRFEQASAYDDLTTFGTFPAVLSLEVVEHLFQPRRFARTIRSLLEPNGIAIISTPYHAYIKDLARALLNRRDDPLWDYGHIKQWTRKTLGELFSEVGMREVAFHRVGRIPQLAKSMVCVFSA